MQDKLHFSKAHLPLTKAAASQPKTAPCCEKQDTGLKKASIRVQTVSRRLNRTSAASNQQELIERVAAASEVARGMKAQLKAAQQKIGDLNSMIGESRTSVAAQSIPSRPHILRAPTDGRTMALGPQLLAASRRRRRKRARQRRRNIAVLVTGLAISLVALIAWRAYTLAHLRTNEGISPRISTADPMTNLALLDDAVARGQPTVTSLTEQVLPQISSPLIEAESDVAQGKIDLHGGNLEASILSDVKAVALREENSHLKDELNRANSLILFLRKALQQARDLSEDEGQDQRLAATVSSARVAALQSKLREAHQKISVLSKAVVSGGDGAVTLSEGGVSQQQDPLAMRALAGSDLRAQTRHNSLTDKPKNPDQTSGRTDVDDVPKFDEVVASASLSPNPLISESEVFQETVSLLDLLLNPRKYLDHRVMVTGPVGWYLDRYWLQSNNGQRGILIDVRKLQAGAQNKLADAFVQTHPASEVWAQIRGTIEREGAASYYLSASKLVIVE